MIFSKSDLTLNGTGSLTIVSAEGHGIVSKDDLKITGGTYDITAAGHALSGKDSVRIADGTFILTAEKDGIHAENADDEEKGYIYIADGDFTITSDGDGMDASNIVKISDVTLSLKKKIITKQFRGGLGWAAAYLRGIFSSWREP